MSNEVNKAFVQQFTDDVRLLTQQTMSKLRGTVDEKDVVGKSALIERIGSVEAYERTSRHADVTQSDTPHSRRRLTIADYEHADYIDKQDELRMLIDPKSPYLRQAASAMGRKMDDVIIAAAQGNSISVNSSDTDSNVALPSSQIVDEDFNTANSDLILEKVIEAKRIMLSNEVQPDEDFAFVADSTSLHTLLQDPDVKTIDSNTIKSIVAGQPGTLMGFEFIHSERLKDSSEGFKNCLAYAKSGITLGLAQDIQSSVDKIPTKGNATQVLTQMSIGATRVEEEKVVIVEAYRA